MLMLLQPTLLQHMLLQPILQHTQASIILKMSTVRLHTDTLHLDKPSLRLEIISVMLLDHTITSTQRERESRSPTLLELMDSKSTPTIYQLLQLPILSSQLLQSMMESHQLHQCTPELHLSQFKIHLRLLLQRLLMLKPLPLLQQLLLKSLLSVRSVPSHMDSHTQSQLDTHMVTSDTDMPTTDMPTSDMPITDMLVSDIFTKQR